MRCVCLTLVLTGWLRPAQPQPKTGPLPVFVMNFETDLPDKSTARNMTDAFESALIQQKRDFRVLERRDLNRLLQEARLDQDAKALAAGRPPSAQLRQALTLKDASAVIAGDVRLMPADGRVQVTVRLTRLDSEKDWQGQRRRLLREWLDLDVTEQEMRSLVQELVQSLAGNDQPPAAPANADLPRGIELASAGKCDQALPYLERAVVVDGLNARAQYYRGRCLNQAGNYRAAYDALTAAIGVDSTRAEFFVERARAAYALGQYGLSLTNADQALRLNNRDSAVYEVRGDIFMQQGQYLDAANAYKYAFDASHDPKVCNKYADAIDRNGNRELAAEVRRGCTAR